MILSVLEYFFTKFSLAYWFFFFGFKIEEQHKKALEEDPSVFDYDGVYDEIKEKIARPRVQDHEERKVL